MTPYLQIPIGLTTQRLFAEWVALSAAYELSISPPRIQFFVHQSKPVGWPLEAWNDERRLAGETREWDLSAVWVLADLPQPELARVVAHEVHHVSWFTYNGACSRVKTRCLCSPAEKAHQEITAEDFALRFTRRINRIRSN